ncbi:beta-lactamase class C and other penicillin binding protein [Phaeosphaeriaceae sp. SRC1lsM3a]|nr:beta-lactamase class C and other penicillin binding protein [Stagonospora sp. SRC1lsM3a]
MSDFDTLLAEYTQKGSARVHGVICKCVDRTGKDVYSKVAGYNSLASDSPPLQEDVVLKLASATKLITTIALLQCVEKGLIGLDESLKNVVPEFADKKILSAVSGEDFTFDQSKTAITARHLLSHTSGLGYPFMHPLLQQRAQALSHLATSKKVVERFDIPLVFEPGTGWLYGCSLDWAGVVVSRLHSGIHLGDYMVEHIWKPLGLSAPFPSFNIALHPEYNARAMEGAARKNDGSLEPCNEWAFDNNEDQDGGAGLSSTAKDFTAVLADLISDSPKLLKPGTIDLMFEPQLKSGSGSIQMLLKLRPVWSLLAGSISEDAINHGLGGLLCEAPVPELGQPGNMLTWGGASNIAWWINREAGVSGFFATQQRPFGNEAVAELVTAWKKDFWKAFNARKKQ